MRARVRAPVRVRVLAVGLAAVLGVAAGVVTAFALPAHVDDPLHLGIAKVDQACDPGRSLVVVGVGDDPTPLASAAARYPGSRYLSPARSCDTAWQYVPPDRRDDPPETPSYVVYLGPFDTRHACEIRVGNKGTQVTALVDGSSDVVQCLCHVGFTHAPELRPGMSVSVSDNVWIRQLQQLLRSSQLVDHVTGDYDAATQQAVEGVQARTLPHPTGVVDRASWRELARALCQ